MSSQHTHLASGQSMLIAILILGTLTLGFILIGNMSLGESAQVNTVLENRTVASAAATACAEQAMDRLGRNPGYTGNETLEVASSTCYVRPVAYSSGIWTIETAATSSNQRAYLRVTLSSIAPPTIRSWTDIAGF